MEFPAVLGVFLKKKQGRKGQGSEDVKRKLKIKSKMLEGKHPKKKEKGLLGVRRRGWIPQGVSLQ